MKEFFGTGQMLIEPIFYAGTGVYDLTFRLLERKYNMIQNDFYGESKFSLMRLKRLLLNKEYSTRKIKKVYFRSKQSLPKHIEKLKKISNEDWENMARINPFNGISSVCSVIFDLEKNEDGGKYFIKFDCLFVVRKSDIIDVEILIHF
jgi:hypothetical protein